MTFKILCCDGGGIRGLMTALLIQDLDKDFHVIEKADGFAGTSTGGLIALALANGVKIEKIINVYETEGSTIFDKSGILFAEMDAEQLDPKNLNAEVLKGPGFTGCEYKNDGLIKIANSLLGNQRLSDAKKYVAINTARLWDTNAWEPTTFSNSSANPYANTLMKDAALATSAAPAYFPPYEIGAYGFFADGGTFANNPTMAAIADAKNGGRVGSLEDIRALSLGTGIDPQGIPPKAISGTWMNPMDWGAIRWMLPVSLQGAPAMPLLNLLMDCTSKMVTEEAKLLLGNNFCRGNVPMTEQIGLDDYKKVPELMDDADKYMKSDNWTKVREWVSENWQ